MSYNNSRGPRRIPLTWFELKSITPQPLLHKGTVYAQQLTGTHFDPERCSTQAWREWAYDAMLVGIRRAFCEELIERLQKVALEYTTQTHQHISAFQVLYSVGNDNLFPDNLGVDLDRDIGDNIWRRVSRPD